MKEKKPRNLKLKIVAVLFAACLWMISININDPYQSKDYSVTVQLLNKNTLTGTGKYVEVLDNSDAITVKVRGTRSVMDTFTASNISATADLNEINADGQVPIKLATVKTSGSKIESIRSGDTYLKVKVEEIQKVQKKLEVITKNEPEEGYILGKVSTEQNALRISGPESAVAMVDKAVVNFDLANATEDVSMLLPVELYDEAGNKISDSRLTMSIEEVQCEASILATKEIPCIFTTKGKAAPGYGFTGEIVCEPSTVLVAAKSVYLRNLSKLEITEAVDIQDARENVVTQVDMREYLPENVILADSSFDGKAKVTAVIEETFSETIEISAEQIELVNLPDGWKGEIKDSENIEAAVKGFASAQSEFDSRKIKAQVDVQSYLEEKQITEPESGTYEMEVTLELPEAFWTEDHIQIKVKILK